MFVRNPSKVSSALLFLGSVGILRIDGEHRGLVSAEEGIAEDISGDLEFEDVSEEWWNSEDWNSEDWEGSEDWNSEDWEGSEDWNSEDWEGSEDWSEDWDPSRTYGPDALIEAYEKHIPQTCIDFPFGTTTVKRCFYTYVPESCYSDSDSGSDLSVEQLGQKKTKLLPLVFDMHGHGGSPLDSAGYSGWMQQAEQHCFVVVWPAGISPSGTYDGTAGAPCWNLPGLLQREPEETSEDNKQSSDDADLEVTTTVPCCCFDEEETVTGMPVRDPDDPLFLKTAVETVAKEFETNETIFSIDLDRVYMAGHSNGCMTSLAMAALHSDTVAAVCCHAGAVITPFEDPSYSPVPIWMVVGVEDDTVPYNGRPIIPNTSPFGTMGFWSVPNTLEYLSHRNECLETDEVRLETNETGVAGTVYRRKSCRNNAIVEIVALDGVGHDPYLEGGTDIDTTAMAWEFCSAHVRSEAAVPQHDSNGEGEGEGDDKYKSYNETDLETIDWTSVKAAVVSSSLSSSSSAPMRRLGYESGSAISVAMAMLLLLWMDLF